MRRFCQGMLWKEKVMNGLCRAVNLLSAMPMYAHVADVPFISVPDEPVARRFGSGEHVVEVR